MADQIIQPSVAKRISFAVWARKNGIRRTSSVTYVVPTKVKVPADLMAGATVDGKPADAKPTTRRRKTKDRGPVSEPSPPIFEGHEPGFQHSSVTVEPERSEEVASDG